MTKIPNPINQGTSPPRQDFDRQISGLLRSMYGAVENEGIPERLLDLLEKLDQAERMQIDAKDR